MQIRPGQPAREFSVQDIDGNTIALFDYRDQRLMLSFYRYASCPLCNLRVQHLIQQYPSYREKGLQMIAVFQSPQASIRKYVGKQNIPFPVIADPASFPASWLPNFKPIERRQIMSEQEKAAFICVKDTLDGAYPSLVLGINAARQGIETKVFYSFMGLNLVLKGGVERAKFFPPGVMGAIPGMTTLATGMMKKKIEQANIPSLSDMQEMAQLEGVELIACHMTVQMMEIEADKLIGDVPIWTAEDFLKYAKDCKICLFT